MRTLSSSLTWQSEADLLPYDNIILATNYNADQQTAKDAFISSALRQSQRMCLPLLNGEDASVAQRTLAIVQSVKLSFQATESNWTKLGCDTCAVKPSYVDFKGLKSVWSNEYACGDDTCTGACVSSMQVCHLE